MPVGKLPLVGVPWLEIAIEPAKPLSAVVLATKLPEPLCSIESEVGWTLKLNGGPLVKEVVAGV